LHMSNVVAGVLQGSAQVGIAAAIQYRAELFDLYCGLPSGRGHIDSRNPSILRPTTLRVSTIISRQKHLFQIVVGIRMETTVDYLLSHTVEWGLRILELISHCRPRCPNTGGSSTQSALGSGAR
jgi:hypothetical protein